MTKTSYTAIDPNGTKHTRKSAAGRFYTHTVITQLSKQFAIEQANEWVAYDTKTAKEEFALAGMTIEAIKAWLRAKQCGILARDDVYATKRQTEGKAFVAKWGTPEAYAAAEHTKRIERIEANDYTIWSNQGWAGRPDLAQKLAAQCRTRRFQAVMILEAVAL